MTQCVAPGVECDGLQHAFIAEPQDFTFLDQLQPAAEPAVPWIDAAYVKQNARTTRLRWTEGILIGAGAVSLAAYLGVAAERAWFQWRTEEELSRSAGSTPVLSLGAQREGLLGRIEIPRVGLSAAILDGVDGKTLRRAVGHVPGTALPGQGGRIALAAHRDTFFRDLRRLRSGDKVRIVTATGADEYVVRTTVIVKPHQTDLLAPSAEPLLTLVTCYPFSYVGSAPDRFVVEARRTSPWPQRFAWP